MIRCRYDTVMISCRYDTLPLLLPELRFSWVPHKYFLVSPGSLGRTVAAKHVQANYELGGRLHQHANSPAGGRRQSAAEQELGTSFDEGMLLMATARRHVHRMCVPHGRRMHTACACACTPHVHVHVHVHVHRMCIAPRMSRGATPEA